MYGEGGDDGKVAVQQQKTSAVNYVNATRDVTRPTTAVDRRRPESEVTEREVNNQIYGIEDSADPYSIPMDPYSIPMDAYSIPDNQLNQSLEVSRECQNPIYEMGSESLDLDNTYTIPFDSKPPDSPTAVVLAEGKT